MRRKLFLFATFLCLMLVCPGLAHGQKSWGWNLHDEQNNEAVGPCTFDASSPGTFKLLKQSDVGEFAISAGAFIGKTYYVYAYRSEGTSARPIGFGTYDFTTFKYSEIADYSTNATQLVDMTYDYKNKVLYALGKRSTSANSYLVKIDPSNGQMSNVQKLDKTYLTLAADKTGQLYAIDKDGLLFKISATGEAEDAGSNGDFMPLEYPQSMAFDHTSGALVWVVPTERQGTVVVKVNPADGSCTELGTLENDRQIVGLDFPYSTVNADAPGALSQFKAEATSPGALEAKISFTAPARTAGAGDLNPVTVFIYRNGAEIHKQENVNPGEAITYTDKVSKLGSYTYKAYAYNAAGPGEESATTLFLGEDIPAEVQNIQLVPTDGGGCKVSWTAPTVGQNGGYVRPNLTYDVDRLPDQVSIAKGTDQLMVEDNNIPKLAVYQYRVTPTGREKGPEAVSATLVLGSTHQLPYECKFTRGDMQLWKIYDANGDGIKWNHIMTDEGVDCGENEKEPSDDWLVSYPLNIKKGVKYKIEIMAKAYSEELPEKMSLLFGKGMNQADLAAYEKVSDFVVKNPEDGKAQKYVAYYTSTHDYAKSLAIHKTSDPGMFRLTIYSIKVSEATEGELKGTIKCGDAPVADATIALQGTEFSTRSSEQGAWSFARVPEGRYTLEATKKGFVRLSQEINVVKDETLPVDLVMTQLKTITITGAVAGADNKPLQDAKVVLRDVKEGNVLTAHTVGDGSFKVENAFEGEYEVTASHSGLKNASATVKLTEAQAAVATLTLAPKAVAPRLVKATVQPDNNVLVGWKAPFDVTREFYHKGEGVANIGVFNPTPRSLVGAVYRHDMALTKVTWKTDVTHGAHKSVDLVVLALDSKGNPTSQVLYEQKNIVNVDNEWTSYELEKPFNVKGGALVALCYNGNLDVYADAGTREGLEFKKNTFGFWADYKTGAFEYLDQHNMEKNLLFEIEYGELLPNGESMTTVQCQKQYQLVRRSLANGGDWQEVATMPAETMSYTDKNFATLPMGTYQYGVKSIVADSEVSTPALSNAVTNNLTANVVFKVTTNAGEVTGTPVITLATDDKQPVVYPVGKNAQGEWVLADLPKGAYVLHAELDGFDPITRKVQYTGDARDFTENVNFIERLLPAFNVKVDKTNKGRERMLSWNSANYFFDDFESYNPFTVEPARPDCNWIYWDRDKDKTVEFKDFTFPHMGEALSFIAFNPYATQPAINFMEQGSLPLSGKQYLASMGNRTQANRDFVFSPILNCTGKVTFNCYLRNLATEQTKAALKVGYTTVEYPKTEADITWLGDNLPAVDSRKWTELNVVVPSQAKRVVLFNNYEKNVFLMIDNMFVGEEYPYADGKIVKPQVDRATYEVMLDGKKVENVDAQKNQALLSGLNKGSHTASVTAVYASGRADTKSITFEIGDESGVNSMTTQDSMPGMNYDPTTQLVEFSDNVAMWSLVSLNGACVARGTAHSTHVHDLVAGVYVARLEAADGTVATVKFIKK